jgi:hypothetical protein
VNIEFDTLNVELFGAASVEMVAVEVEFFKFTVERGWIHAQVNQRANEHVTADAAEDVEIQGFHFVRAFANELIWLAA